ncbi:dynein regulatory complex subunit 3-like [Coccinella septempunctata]|uniref:dynein regulatory complex subunit 3-like n=1 Tax=Coccinella septempunctata TaxID=41139 RepID=UPI001D0994F3|nr:dynein regulatory complex subunit 3-like [Coccinella septempunctata]
MQNIEDPCAQKIPRAIDDEFLQEKLLELTRCGETGRLARIEGLPFEKAEIIHLDYCNILKLDHLWVLTNLRKLVLNNNLIDKIENIHMLIHLTHLDLSFNRLTKIEGIETLVNLEQLSLFDNQISEIENLETLQKLVIFSIGRNRIAERSSVIYLRQLENLKSLNMAENPCAYEENFRLYIAAFLPQLVYYEYRFIYELEREVGMETFSDEYNQIVQVEAIEKARKAAKQKELADAQLHARSFVEYLNTRAFFDSLFLDDPEGKAFLEIGEDMAELYIDFEENVIAECKTIFRLGQEQYELRQIEIDYYNSSVQNAKAENQKKSIAYMEDFLEKKDDIFEEIRQGQERFVQIANIEDYNQTVEIQAEIFQNLVQSTWKSLMKMELELFEQMVDVNETFEHTLTDLINNFIEAAQGLFTRIRDLESDFSDAVAEIVKRYHVNISMTEDPQIPPALREIMADKDTLANALGASHDVHALLIDTREDTLINNAREWLEKLVTNLEKDETNRNRDKVMEISHFMDVQREEFDTLANAILENQVLTLGLME